MRRFVVAALLAPILTACRGSEPSGPAVVATITLSPTALSLASLGQTQQVTSTVKDQSGTAIANAAVTWSSSNTGVASVSAGGMVTATGNGPATIQAAAAAVSANVTVDVYQEVATVSIEPSLVQLA